MLKYKFECHLDDPRRSLIHREIILKNSFLKKLYLDWYSLFECELKGFKDAKIIELGSGGGFLKEVIPCVQTSDVMPLEGNDLTFSALDMPFKNNSIDAILMVDVFHHIRCSEQFLKEAYRTLKKGGKIIMVEPYNSVWGRFIFQNFHHETFNPNGDWKIPSTGPLSDANGALPWIVFKRDVRIFQSKFPGFKLKLFKIHTPLRYLMSGGLSFKQIIPGALFLPITWVEKLFSFSSPLIGMFCNIVVVKE